MKILKLLSAICWLGIITSCSKNNNTVNPAKQPVPPGGIQKGTISGGAGVYVAGYEIFYHVGADSLAVAAGVPNVAKVWKNGIAVNLTDGTYDAYAAAVYANATDVYVAGYENNAVGFKVATLWKNGTPIRLGDGKNDTYATSIAVDGADVYVAGNMITNSLSAGMIWKNGTGSALPNCATANSVAAYKGNFYVCGSDTGLIPTLWTNGVGVNLSGAGVGVANWIATSNAGERYIGGDFENNGTVAGYWHNEKFKLLGYIAGEGYGSGEIKSVFIDGGDVYLLGFNAYGPVLWKNEVPKAIDINPPTPPGAMTYSGNSLIAIGVSNTDVLMAGWRTTSVLNDNKHIHDIVLPLLWKNGTLSLLDNGDVTATKKIYNKTGGQARAIFIVK